MDLSLGHGTFFDLLLCSFFLWTPTKTIACMTPVKSIEKIKQRIRTVFLGINIFTLGKLWKNVQLHLSYLKTEKNACIKNLLQKSKNK